MKKLFVFSLFILSVLTYSEGLTGYRAGSGSKASKYDIPKTSSYTGGGYAQEVNNNLTKETTGKPSQTSRRGIGLSAWGIIAITLSVIMLSAGTYYFIIFYPLVCKKERNYDVIELSPV